MKNIHPGEINRLHFSSSWKVAVFRRNIINEKINQNKKLKLLNKNQKQLLELRSLYQIPGFQFVFPEPALRGVFEIVDAQVTDREIEDALYLNLNYNGKTESVALLGGRGYVNSPKSLTIDDLDFHLSYGSNEVQLPFSIQLNDFIAEKYPGTENSYCLLYTSPSPRDS